jgi:hypothetical protein
MKHIIALAALLLLAITAAHDTRPGAIARRDEPTVTAVPAPGSPTVTSPPDSTAAWTLTRKGDHKHPPWTTTVDALAKSAYYADMRSLHNRIKVRPPTPFSLATPGADKTQRRTRSSHR